MGDRERFPLPSPTAMSPDQAAAVREIVEGPRGSFGGPFVPLLRRPELLSGLQTVGLLLRYESVTDRRLMEFAVLLVARRWNQAFEWGVHAPAALEAGVPRAAVEAVARNERPAVLDPPLAAVWDLFYDLDTTTTVSDSTFEAAREVLGDEAVVELVAAFGYYTTLAMVMNTAGPAHRRTTRRSLST